MTRRILLSAIIALAALPGVAHASTIADEGGTLVVRHAPGEAGSLHVRDSYPAGQLRVEAVDPITSIPGSCELVDESTADCAIPQALRVELGDGNDRFGFGDGHTLGLPIEVLGGDGDDVLHGDADRPGREVLDGGLGRDNLDGFGGDDEVRGGPGNDTVDGDGGRDVVLGGEGDDVVVGDDQAAPAADLVDGGPGSDQLEEYVEYGTDVHPPAGVSLDGVANDGRPGEGDDVRGVERGIAYVSGRFVLSDGPDDWQIVANMDSGTSVVLAGGGDDRIVGHDAPEDVDGGAGTDHLEGGRGHDVLRGGPGRDTIFGDETSSSCRPAHPEGCVRYGNDVIDARDGEADQVDCGPGVDRVAADAVDVVAQTCEVVEVGSGAPGTGVVGGPGTGRPGPVARRPTLAVAGRPTLRGVLRRGLTLRLTGARPGKASFTARLGARRVATGTVRVPSSGRATLRLRVTKAGRRLLAGRRRATLTVTGAGLRRPWPCAERRMPEPGGCGKPARGWGVVPLSRRRALGKGAGRTDAAPGPPLHPVAAGPRRHRGVERRWRWRRTSTSTSSAARRPEVLRPRTGADAGGRAIACHPGPPGGLGPLPDDVCAARARG